MLARSAQQRIYAMVGAGAHPAATAWRSPYRHPRNYFQFIFQSHAMTRSTAPAPTPQLAPGVPHDAINIIIFNYLSIYIQFLCQIHCQVIALTRLMAPARTPQLAPGVPHKAHARAERLQHCAGRAAPLEDPMSSAAWGHVRSTLWKSASNTAPGELRPLEGPVSGAARGSAQSTPQGAFQGDPGGWSQVLGLETLCTRCLALRGRG